MAIASLLQSSAGSVLRGQMGTLAASFSNSSVFSEDEISKKKIKIFFYEMNLMSLIL